ncbi:probable inactive receptor kinase At2g26730 [Nicotiana tomentosiformis]|uniref:probable inactive receptor kinase At2g26730 n=1 Tax=Nicotiana tomentosiformis TaxID=4098 RepID=UPI00051B1B2A|nr:probable inactive receptor kinase At2g26730 [Nicotiana tomentosiformis]
MAVFSNSRFVFCALFFASILSQYQVVSEPKEEKQALLAFLSQIPHANRVQWNSSSSACNWFGVECDPTNSSVYSLRLPAVGLVGQIPANTLGRLSQLRVLSLHANRLSGSIPSDFSNLELLRSLYLQNNRFSGGFPESLIGLTRLNRLDISSNNFTGNIPFSINNLTHLTGLLLNNNGFSGNLPSINPTGLVNFNVSNNQLNGSVPTTLSKFPASSFSGNIDLCGGPLPPCTPFFPSPSSSPSPSSVEPKFKRSKKLSTAAIVGIAVGSGLGLLLLLLFLFLCLRRKLTSKESTIKTQKLPTTTAAAFTGAGEAGTSSSKDDLTVEGERNKLVFFNGRGGYSFDLEDLLRASAEVLGKGSVGTSYKAVLEEGTTVVVKRLKDVVVTRKEFEQQMDVLGKMKHENVLPLRAFYYSKDEKLLVSDYIPAGSLSSLLHGSRGSGRTPLDWDSRMRIVLSAARGISYLHISGKIVHGNIKASNVLLKQENNQDYACVSDYGLNPLFSITATPVNNHRVAGYRAPEVLETRKVTFKSDVYSFGVLILELLTGKAPNQASLGDEGIDLPRWVQSVVREEWTAEVFDVELMRYHNVEEEMVQLLQIGMACVAIVPDQRPSMAEVVRMIEEMNRDDGLRQSSDDPSKGSEGQTPPQESRDSPRGVTP